MSFSSEFVYGYYVIHFVISIGVRPIPTGFPLNVTERSKMEEREKALESLIPMASNVECLPLLLQSLPNVLAALAEHPVTSSAMCGVSHAAAASTVGSHSASTIGAGAGAAGAGGSGGGVRGGGGAPANSGVTGSTGVLSASSSQLCGLQAGLGSGSVLAACSVVGAQASQSQQQTAVGTAQQHASATGDSNDNRFVAVQLEKALCQVLRQMLQVSTSCLNTQIKFFRASH